MHKYTEYVHVTSAVGEHVGLSVLQVYIVHVCNIALYLAYVQGLFTMRNAGKVSYACNMHYHTTLT